VQSGLIRPSCSWLLPILVSWQASACNSDRIRSPPLSRDCLPGTEEEGDSGRNDNPNPDSVVLAYPARPTHPTKQNLSTKKLAFSALCHLCYTMCRPRASPQDPGPRASPCLLEIDREITTWTTAHVPKRPCIMVFAVPSKVGMIDRLRRRVPWLMLVGTYHQCLTSFAGQLHEWDALSSFRHPPYPVFRTDTHCCPRSIHNNITASRTALHQPGSRLAGITQHTALVRATVPASTWTICCC
jgi:transposase